MYGVRHSSRASARPVLPLLRPSRSFLAGEADGRRFPEVRRCPQPIPTDPNRSISSSRAPISAATARNWARLQTNASAEARLVSRANKQCSAKRIEPTEYLTHPENLACVRAIVDYADRRHLGIPEVLLSLGLSLLTRAGLQAKPHVAEVLREYQGIAVDPHLATVPLPTDEVDLLGLVYQCLLSEGHKNRTGSYYTPKIVVDRMLDGLSFEKGETLLDPCCGSGSFLLAAPAPIRNSSSERTSTRRPS